MRSEFFPPTPGLARRFF